MINRIRNYIKREELNTKDRHRPKNYKRMIIAKLLREEEFTLQGIGLMLKRDHATVINMLKNYSVMVAYSDFRELEKKVRHDLNIKTLEERVLECTDYWQMVKLQEELQK